MMVQENTFGIQGQVGCGKNQYRQEEVAKQ